MSVLLVATVVNSLSGIAKFKFSKRVITFLALFGVAEIMVRVKKSDRIFYSLPKLSQPELEAERQMILRESLVVDGKINGYDINKKMDDELETVAQSQTQE